MSYFRPSSVFKLDTKDIFSQIKKTEISKTVGDIDEPKSAKDVSPERDQEPKHEEDQRDFWDKQATDKSGVLLGHVEGDDDNLKLLKEFVNQAMQAQHLRGNRLCLELACGGALLLFDNVLIELFEKTDVNESSHE